MDLQNVSNINVPQGEVRTIHDKDNRLLWGRVSYDTTYRGDTQQTTYTGKNLLNVPSSYSFTVGPISISLPAGTYHLSCGNVTKGSTNNPVVVIANSAKYLNSNTDITFTLTSDITEVYFYSNGWNYSASVGVTSTVVNLMISTSGGVYEPYVGGIPSPNPDYPQGIDVVTGEQSVKIRTGKNMIDLTSATTGYLVLHTNGQLSPNANYSASDWIPVKANGHYYQTATNTWYSCYYDVNKNFIAQINSRNIRPTQDGYVRLSWENTKADQVMMEVGDSGTTYEAYQGKSYDVNLTSKNLFDSSLLPASWSSMNIVKIALQMSPNTKYTMSSNIPLDRGLYANLFFYDSSGAGTTATNGVAPNKSVTVTTLSDGILKIGYRSNYGDLINRDDYWYQIEEGDTATTYTPYFTPIELVKVGTYQDYIYKSSGNWYVHKAMGKSVLDGSENDWGYQNGVFRTFFDDAMRDINAVLVMSNYFTGQTTRYRDDISNSCCAKVIGANSQIGFRYDAMNGDVPTWKTWLSTHNTTIYYVLATSTDTQITDVTLLSQLNAVHQWLTRYGYQYGVVGTLPIIIDQEDLS